MNQQGQNSGTRSGGNQAAGKVAGKQAAQNPVGAATRGASDAAATAGMQAGMQTGLQAGAQHAVGWVPQFSASQAGEIEAFVLAVLESQRRGAEVSAVHRAAMSRADLLGISQAVTAQEQHARGLLQLEQHREHLLTALGVPVRLRAASGGGGLKLSALVAGCPEPRRTRLMALLAEAGELTRKNAESTRAIEAASRSLLTHMQSLMTNVRRALMQTGVYGNRGAHHGGGDGAFTPALAAVGMDVAG